MSKGETALKLRDQDLLSLAEQVISQSHYEMIEQMDMKPAGGGCFLYRSWQRGLSVQNPRAGIQQGGGSVPEVINHIECASYLRSLLPDAFRMQAGEIGTVSGGGEQAEI